MRGAGPSVTETRITMRLNPEYPTSVSHPMQGGTDIKE